MRRVGVVLLAMGVLVGCKQDEVKPTTHGIPSELGAHHFKAPAGSRFKELFVYDTNLVASPGGPTLYEGDVRFYILDGEATPTGYRATRLAIAVLEQPLVGKSYWRQTTACSGTVTVTRERVLFELAAPAECAVANGSWLTTDAAAPAAAGGPAVAPGSTAPAPTGGACRRYRDCTCALASWAPRAGRKGAALAPALATNCDDAERLLRTAPDDPMACQSGVALALSLARELAGGAPLPEACR